MPDRFMNLQPQLRAVENDVERAFRTLLRAMQRNRLFGDTARVLDQLQLIDQLVALVLPLSTVRIGVRPFLNLVVRKCIGSVTRACRILRLMNIGSLRRYEPLLLSIEVEVALGEGNTGNGTQFGVDIQQQRNVLLNRNREWINHMGRGPLRSDGLLGSEEDILLLHLRRRTGTLNGPGCRSFNPSARKVFGGGESPRSVGKHAHAHPSRFGISR